jgi:spore germination protein YaaH
MPPAPCVIRVTALAPNTSPLPFLRSPYDIAGRNYDWLGLAEAADTLFIMAYDTESQVGPVTDDDVIRWCRRPQGRGAVG